MRIKALSPSPSSARRMVPMLPGISTASMMTMRFAGAAAPDPLYAERAIEVLESTVKSFSKKLVGLTRLAMPEGPSRSESLSKTLPETRKERWAFFTTSAAPFSYSGLLSMSSQIKAVRISRPSLRAMLCAHRPSIGRSFSGLPWRFSR